MYATSDAHLAISLGSLEGLQAILEMAEDQRVSDPDSFRLREKAAAVIAAKLAERSTEHWVELFTRHKIWHSRVNDYDAVMVDPQVRHNQSFATVEGATGTPITLVGHPIRYDGEVPQTRQPPQRLGAQTSEILREIGCSDEEISSLVGAKVVAAPA